MKKSRKIVIFCFSILFLMSISEFIGISYSYKNAPYNNKNPENIQNYTFKERDSDYGTHDWVADAALRFLYEKNASKWNWLFHDKYDTAPDLTLKRNPNYRDFNGKHNVIRSYLYFLLGTHWPNFRNAPLLEFKEEGESIRNYKYNLKKWIGDTHYHNFYYNITESSNSIGYDFIVKNKKYTGSKKVYQKAPEYADMFGDLAVRCLNHKEINKEGRKESWAKIEAAAFYLGCMTHYIVDLSSIPHILRSDDLDPKGKKIINYYDTHRFHQWYERNVEYFTYWGSSRNKILGAGPNDDFFVIDLERIGKTIQSIVPIEPDLAAIGLSKTIIEESFGEILGGPFPKNLYINKYHNDIIKKWWTWEFSQREKEIEIVPNALTYKEYFDKVEKILIYAIFYTACAILWVRNKVEEKTKINPDKWAEIPFDKKKGAEPISVPDKEDILNKEKEERYRNLDPSELFVQSALMAPIFALVIIPYIINTSKKVIIG